MKAIRVFLLGRPNVGKSSLFNALVGYRRAIVFDKPGTTLDEVTETVSWNGKQVQLSDSQGIFGEENEWVLESILERMDACLFVVDAKTGLTPYDKWLAKKIFHSKCKALLCINKCDGKDSTSVEFATLGFDHMEEVSASHRRNLDALKEWCATISNTEGAKETPELNIALIGRPNAGKSTLMNQLCEQKVSRVSAKAHTTRDPVSFEVETSGGLVRIVDTAGMRRRRTKGDSIEKLSVHLAKKALSICDVAFILIDTSQPLTDQDLNLIRIVNESYKPTLVLLNFWDKLDELERQNVLRDIKEHPLFRRFKTHPISALEGWNIHRCLPLAFKLKQGSQVRITTSKLNQFVRMVTAKNPPPSKGRGKFNILYASQVEVTPPTFVFFMNRMEALPKTYKAYLNNELRKNFGFKGQPIRLKFRV